LTGKLSCFWWPGNNVYWFYTTPFPFSIEHTHYPYKYTYMKNPINCPVKDQSSRVKTIINNTRLRLQQGMANEKSNCNCNWHLPPFWFRPTLITWLTYDLKWAWPIWGRFKYRTLRDCCGRPINFICCIKTLWQTRLGLILLLLIAFNLENVIKYYEETIYLLISSKMFFSWCHLKYYSEPEFS